MQAVPGVHQVSDVPSVAAIGPVGWLADFGVFDALGIDPVHLAVVVRQHVEPFGTHPEEMAVEGVEWCAMAGGHADDLVGFQARHMAWRVLGDTGMPVSSFVESGVSGWW